MRCRSIIHYYICMNSRDFRYMGSGIKGLNRGGIRDHSSGIWDHNPWDRDQQCLHGIRNHSVLHNNKNHKNHKTRVSGFIWDFQSFSAIFRFCFSWYLHYLDTGYGHAIRRFDSFTLVGLNHVISHVSMIKLIGLSDSVWLFLA